MLRVETSKLHLVSSHLAHTDQSLNAVLSLSAKLSLFQPRLRTELSSKETWLNVNESSQTILLSKTQMNTLYLENTLWLQSTVRTLSVRAFLAVDRSRSLTSRSSKRRRSGNPSLLHPLHFRSISQRLKTSQECISTGVAVRYPLTSLKVSLADSFFSHSSSHDLHSPRGLFPREHDNDRPIDVYRDLSTLRRFDCSRRSDPSRQSHRRSTGPIRSSSLRESDDRGIEGRCERWNCRRVRGFVVSTIDGCRLHLHIADSLPPFSLVAPCGVR